MPAILTHYTFARFESIKPDRKHFGALILGSQGPDPFFFYGMLPWRKRANSQEVNAFGIGLHHREVTPLYTAMIDYANKSEDKEMLFDFIEGLFLHYILDRNCHPYVFSVAGYSDEPKLNKYYSSWHTKIESAIDMLYAGSKGAFDEDAGFSLRTVTDEELIKISRMIFAANDASDKCPSIGEASYFLAVKDYDNAMRFINKPHFIKRAFLAIAMGRNSTPFALNYPHSLKGRYGNTDLTNDAHKEWAEPTTGKMKTESFYDLMAKAKKEYLRFLPILAEAKAGLAVTEDIHAFYDGIDHSGVKDGASMIHMNPLFPPQSK